jgi:hypothetical protein
MTNTFKSKSISIFVNKNSHLACALNANFCHFVVTSDATPDPNGFAYKELGVQQVSSKVGEAFKTYYQGTVDSDAVPKGLTTKVIPTDVTNTYYPYYSHSPHLPSSFRVCVWGQPK